MSVGYDLWTTVSGALENVLTTTEEYNSPPEITDAVNQLGNSMATLLQTRWEELDSDLQNLVAVLNEYNLPLPIHDAACNLIETMQRYGLAR